MKQWTRINSQVPQKSSLPPSRLHPAIFPVVFILSRESSRARPSPPTSLQAARTVGFNPSFSRVLSVPSHLVSASRRSSKTPPLHRRRPPPPLCRHRHCHLVLPWGYEGLEPWPPPDHHSSRPSCLRRREEMLWVESTVHAVNSNESRVLGKIRLVCYFLKFRDWFLKG